MGVIVQKFGGTSVADPDRIRRCAQRAFDARAAGNDVVVVVSAMGDTTDKLVELAAGISASPPKREMDQLLAAGEQVSIALTAMALQELGQPAVSLTGAQCGFRTDGLHTRARITSIDRERIQGHLDQGRIVVVAGFQGISAEGEPTTLGRGGSDTSAVALGVAMEATACEIYTDVRGVYTADPRRVPTARKLERISYEEMFELSAMGAGVMATRAVMLGMKYGVPLHVRHSQLEETGTLIVPEVSSMEAEQVTGVALKTGVGRVTMLGFPSAPGSQGRLFWAIAEAGVLVDDIIQNEVGDKQINVSFTVDQADLSDVKPVLERELGAMSADCKVRIDVGLSRVSAVGVGMRSQTGVAARMFAALGDAEGGPVAIENITTSEIKIACIVAEADGERALRAVHDAFGLGE